MATLTVYPSLDGVVQRGSVSETWATIKAGAGNAHDNTVASNDAAYLVANPGVADRWAKISRGIFLFDTSAMGSGATVTAAVMSLYIYDKNQTATGTSAFDIYASTPASTSALADADFTQVGSTSQTGAATTYASVTVGAYWDNTFNATGRGNVSTTGISKFGCREVNFDVGAGTPTWSADPALAGISCRQSEYAATTNDPKLVVTYTPAGPAGVKTINDIAVAPIKTWGGVSLQSIKTIG